MSLTPNRSLSKPQPVEGKLGIVWLSPDSNNTLGLEEVVFVAVTACDDIVTHSHSFENRSQYTHTGRVSEHCDRGYPRFHAGNSTTDILTLIRRLLHSRHPCLDLKWLLLRLVLSMLCLSKSCDWITFRRERKDVESGRPWLVFKGKYATRNTQS